MYPCAGLAELIDGEALMNNIYPDDEAKTDGGLLKLMQISVTPSGTLTLSMLMTAKEWLDILQDKDSPEQGTDPTFKKKLWETVIKFIPMTVIKLLIKA